MKSTNPTVGQLERKTQNRIVGLFRERLYYDYLGNWEDREQNSNIEEEQLQAFLARSGYSRKLIEKAVADVKRAAGSQVLSLYELNKGVYGLLRYGVKVKEELGDNYQTLWLIESPRLFRRLGYVSVTSVA